MSDQQPPRQPSQPPPRPRLAPLDPQALDERQRSLYDAIAGGPRRSGPFRLTDDADRLLGPFDALLRTPGVGDAVQRLGAALRFEGGLADRTRELVILAVAAHWSSDYEWYAHVRVGARVGVPAGAVEALARGELDAASAADDLDEGERTALRLAAALLGERAVDDATWSAVRAAHGEAGAVELALLVGYYQALAGLLATVAAPAPEPTEPPLRGRGATA